MNPIVVYTLLALIAACSVATLIVALCKKPTSNNQAMQEMRQSIDTSTAVTREMVNNQSTALTSAIQSMNTSVSEQVNAVRAESARAVDTVLQVSQNLASQNTQSNQVLADTVRSEMRLMREENQNQLSEIRRTVDEQLQTNLEKKLQESFRTVSEQLASVQRGLGEMNKLASDVGDLRKTLSNVKTRGIWGEVQLGAILSEILSPEQYDTNVVTVPRTTNRVEFAIKLPGQGDKHVYLPIDSKFPGDTYTALLDAYDSANPAAVEAAWKTLEATLLSEARDIHEKYVSVPDTTDFAIMFLPVEGLYAEAVRHGMIEKLQQKYKINIAGPTTMAALLNSLQMGFKTLQIQKESSNVWKVLQGAKLEFGKFSTVLTKVQDRLKQTQDELETLVGVRTRQLNASLAKVEQYSPALPESEE